MKHLLIEPLEARIAPAALLFSKAAAVASDGPSISINDATLTEGDNGDSLAVFTVTRSGPSTTAVTFDFQTVDDTAISTGGSADFAAKAGSGMIAAGATTTTITVSVHGDLNKEATERFFIDLTNAQNATVADGRGEGTINDNDPAPKLTIGDVSISEGDSGTKNATFTVTLSAESNLPVMVSYSSVNGTAVSGSDFSLAPGTLTFQPGTLTQQITVPINGDTVDEADETFSVKLDAPSGATIARDTATGKILNDDLTITIDDNPSIVEGDSGTAGALFTVHLSSASTHPVQVNFATADGTATVADGDYSATNGTVIFDAGQTTQTLLVPIKGDVKDERMGETFSVNLSAPQNAKIGDGTGIGTILNDDGNPGLVIDDLVISEGDSGTSNATFTVHLLKTSTETITVNYATQDGTAIGGSDYTTTSGALEFLPGVMSKTITVPIVGDQAAEADETFTVQLSGNSANSSLSKASATGTIHDARTLSIFNATRSEGNAGTTTFQFTVSLDAPAEQEITVKFATADGTATVAGNDYAAQNGTLTFAVGQQTKTVDVLVNGDTVSESDETFTVTLSDATQATIVGGTATGKIANDESTFKIVSNSDESTAEVVVTEGTAGAGAATNAVFKVIRGGDTSKAAAVQYQTLDGTAVSSGARPDFTASGLTTLSFAAGETSKTISIPITQDTNRETQESFTVALSNPTDAVVAPGQGLGTVKITDDDAITVNILDPATIDEGDSGQKDLEFTVRLSGADETGPVSVHFKTADGTAISTGTSKDFDAIADGTVTFAAGETEKKVVVHINGDLIDETDLETFSVDLNTPQNVVIGDGHAVGTIRDNDVATILFGGAANGDITLVEGNAGTTNATFTVKLSTVSDSTVTVNYLIEDGTATSTGTASDFSTATPTGTLTFQPGETEKTVVVAVKGDAIFEGDETFNVKLSAPTGAAISDALAVGTITNDDAAPTLSIDNVAIVEGDSGTTNAIFTVTLTGDAQDAVTVDFATADNTAKDGVNDGLTRADYTATHGTLTFSGAEKTKTISVPIVGDLFKESSENFFVNLTNAQHATLATAQGIGTIGDTDSIVGVRIGDVKVVEGNLTATQQAAQTTATFQIELSGPAAEAVTFTATTANNSAIAGADYLSASAVVTIAAGQTSGTFPVTVLGDVDFESGATESFSVRLSGISANALGDRVEGTGFIYNDDRTISRDGRTVQYMDVDGDVVSVKISKGAFNASGSQFHWVKAGSVGGEQLQFIDLRGATQFSRANLSVTAAPAPGFPGVSDGHVNVGFIIAAQPDPATLQFTQGIDLGTVFVEGDLGRIDAGDSFVTPAIGKLEVMSFGAVAGTLPDGGNGQPVDRLSFVLGPLSRLVVHGDFAGDLRVFGQQYGDIGSVQIDGALTGSAGTGHIFFSGTLGKATIGRIDGGTVAGSGRIIADPTTHANIGSITVTGDVTGGLGDDSGSILAERVGSVSLGSVHGGVGAGSGSLQAATAIISKVQIGTARSPGQLVGGSGERSGLLLIGASPSVRIFGDIVGGAGDRSGGIEAVASLGSIEVTGDVVGGNSSAAKSVVSSGYISAAKIGTVIVDGDLIAGTDGGAGIAASGAIRALDTIGALTIKGSVTGNASNSALISAGGVKGAGLAPSTLVLKSIKLATETGASVHFAEILAGYGSTISKDVRRGLALNADAQIGNVFIGGNISGTDIVAGAAAGTDGRFGTPDDLLIGGGNSSNNAKLISRIASVVIVGQIQPDAATANAYGIVAQEIGSIKIGTSAPVVLPASPLRHTSPLGDPSVKFTAVQLEMPT